MAIDICSIVGRDKNHLVQKVLDYDKLGNKKLNFPMLVSEKIDGVFCFACQIDGEEHIFSRTGEEYLSMEHLKAPLKCLIWETGYSVIIFEAYCEGTPQPTISGWCRDTKNQHTELRAYVHDVIPKYDFLYKPTFTSSLMCIPYQQRQEAYMRHSNDGYAYLDFAINKQVDSLEELQALATHLINIGCEGIVARDPNALYQAGKRNKTMIKIKRKRTFDLRCIAVKEGTGKYTGMVGYLVCEDAKGTRIKVGTGLNDEQRKRWWSSFFYDEVVSKIVEIEAMAVTAKGILREPRFKGIREDKTEVDTIA